MIEPAEAADGAAILAITAQIAIFTQADKDCVAELWEQYDRRGAESSGYHFVVARQDERVVGYACYGPTPLTQSTWDLYWLAVDPTARRQGAGRALVAAFEAHAQAEGGTLLLVETSGLWDYAGTRRFYESCGYRYQSVIHDFYALGDDLLTLGKRF